MAREPREVAERIVRELRAAGHEAYFAGGCVRDELLGWMPKDYDIATDATPDEVAGLFRSTREVGKAFGVVLVRMSGVTVEVTTFRSEGEYSDRRRPDSVTFSDAESDARRRDFTINALFLDPLAPGDAGEHGTVIDFVGGRADLESGVVRAVGDPDARLAEDNLRALRAVRFASRLGFEIEPATREAIHRHARELAGVSRERIGDELRRMLTLPSRGDAVRLAHELGLDGPALAEPDGGPIEPRVVSGLNPDADLGLALAGWAIDRGAEPEQGRATASRWRAALCLSNEETERVASVLNALVRLEGEWDSLGVAGKKRLASSDAFEGALALAKARDGGRARRIAAEVEALSTTAGGLSPPALVTGDDLIRAGLRPGREFGSWLDAAYDAQLEGRVSTPAEALALVRGLAGGESGR